MTYFSTNSSFLISASAGKTYAFKNIELSFKEKLLNGGVVFYNNIENQNNKNIINYINTSVLKSSSIGVTTLATSVGQSTRFTLANVSEFPHGAGLFQMKNIVIGTTSAGKLGKTEDAIIQVKNIGSTVRIMWPSQGSQDTDVRGIGDFSTGQRPGRLNNETQYGDFYDCTKFDHMTLYCGVQKQVSGTIDDLLISVERRPFTNTAFAIEQGISYSTSGSYTVGQLTDLVYKKQINFGDLTNREIIFPIDIPLQNTKEIRISAKLSSGQNAENSNLIVWGRFVKSNSQQTET